MPQDSRFLECVRDATNPAAHSTVLPRPVVEKQLRLTKIEGVVLNYARGSGENAAFTFALSHQAPLNF